jgi:hypothetical protein
MLKCPLSPHSKQANDCAFLTLGATSLERFITPPLFHSHACLIYDTEN